MNQKYLLISAVFLALSLVSAGSYSGSLSVSSGQGKIIISGGGQLPEHYCGNNILETWLGEQCDGTNLGGQTCESLGLLYGKDWTGTLSCSNNCTWDTSSCSVVQSSTPSRRSGGGGGSGRCVEYWQCTDWSACTDGKQIRTCEDLNNCETELLKPAESRACILEGEEGEAGTGMTTEKEEEKGFFSRITGAVIGGGVAGTLIPIMFILVVGLVAIIIFVIRKKA